MYLPNDVSIPCHIVYHNTKQQVAAYGISLLIIQCRVSNNGANSLDGFLTPAIAYCNTALCLSPYSRYLWPPYGIRQAIIFLPGGFFFFLLFFSPNLSRRRFKSCSRQRCVTTLGKLFTPMCLCHQAV